MNLRPLRPLGAATAALWLAACAGIVSGYGPGDLRVGAPEADVLQRMGPPTQIHALPGAVTRLEFARGPMGRHTFMIDLDAQRRVTQWEQVLDADHFAAVTDGMASDELLRLLGRPAHRMGRRLGEVWSWRDPTTECLWFRVDIGRDARVINGGSYGIDPQCDVNTHARE